MESSRYIIEEISVNLPIALTVPPQVQDQGRETLSRSPYPKFRVPLFVEPNPWQTTMPGHHTSLPWGT